MTLTQYVAAHLYNRGTRALDRDDPHESQRALLASLACAPYTGQSWLNLGNAFMQEGDVHAALGCYRRAMTLENHPRGAVNAAIALLTLGQWEEGWRLYEQRFALPEFQIRNGLKGGDASKMWRGESLEGKTLLVFNEQGVGDTIMCLRYGWDLMFRGAQRVIYRVPASLLRLVRASHAGGSLVQVVTDSEPMPEHDYIVPFMSLHHHCGRDQYLFPANAKRYLNTREDEPQTYRRPGFNVGLVWAGNPHHKGDKRRSMTREQLSAIELPGVTFQSFQVGHDFQPIDYYDTAVRLKSIDLLITVDTSIAHLAGGLGVPTWVMLPYAADFRWGRTGETTPWYSSMRLFRQTTAGDWSSVIEKVRNELRSLTSTRSAA